MVFVVSTTKLLLHHAIYNENFVDMIQNSQKPLLPQPIGLDQGSDLALARNVIQALIPRTLPEVAGLDMASLFVAGSTLGGDLFDVIRLSDDLVAFIMFDVSGTGVASALLSSLAKASFIHHCSDVQSPRIVLTRVNADLHEQITSDYFLTAFVAVLDLHNNKLTYCNGAHAWPLVYARESNALSALKSSGLFVGLFSDSQYEEKSIFLNPGDWLVMFSNGLYRLFDTDHDLVGRRVFEGLVLKAAPLGTLSDFMADIKARIDNAPVSSLDDDIALIAVHLQTQSRMSLIREKLGFEGIEPVYLQVIHYFEDMDCAAAAILRDMDEFGYPDDSIRKMKIALTELLANAIFHGNNKDHSKKVTVGHRINKHEVIVSIMDEGDGFSVDNVPDPTLPENLEKDCGRGIFIVRNYVDSLIYNDCGNRVTIVKKHIHG